MSTIDLTDAELAAIRRAIEEDRFPRAPRLNLLRSARVARSRDNAATPP